MSNKNRRLKVGGSDTSGITAWGIYSHQLQDLEGRLLTLIEAMGLPQKQEDAIKGLVRQEIWKLPEGHRYIPDEIMNKIFEYNSVRLEKDVSESGR